MELQYKTTTDSRFAKITRIGKQIVFMGFAWSVLGVLIGANTGLIQGGDTIGIVSQMIAWAIVMWMMGGILALMGSQIRAVLFIAFVGAIIGLGGDWFAGHSWPHLHANQGLLMGAIVGTTIAPFLKMYLYAAKGIRAALNWATLRPVVENQTE